MEGDALWNKGGLGKITVVDLSDEEVPGPRCLGVGGHKRHRQKETEMNFKDTPDLVSFLTKS